MSQAWQRLAPPGWVAQPADRRRERQDGGPGLKGRPLDPPDGTLGEHPAEYPADQPDHQRNCQERTRPVADGSVNEQVRELGRRQLPLQDLDLLERQTKRGQHGERCQHGVDPIGSPHLV